MAGRIGSLYAEIGADTTKLQRGLADAKTALGQTKADMQKTADAATRLGADFRQTGAITDDWIGALRASTPENAKYAQSVERITGEFQAGKISAGQAADQLEAVRNEMRQSEAAAKKMEGGLTGVKNKFDEFKSSLLPAAAIVGGFGLALKKTYDMAKEGAALEFAQGKFERLAESIGTTSDVLLGDLKKATRGTVSDMTLMGSAGDFMALGLAKSREEVVRLTRVAGALGMDMNQLVLTLTNQTTMRFDALGVSVDGFDEKVAALKATGMDANKAFTEAFLRQAEEQITKVGDKADTTAGKFATFEANVANLSTEMKMRLVPVADRVITALNGMMTWEKGMVGVIQEHEGAVRTSAKSYDEYNAEMERSIKLANIMTPEFIHAAGGYDKARKSLGLLTEAEFRWSRAQQDGTLAAKDMNEVLATRNAVIEEARERTAKFAEENQRAREYQEMLTERQDAYSAAVENGSIKVQTYNDEVNRIVPASDDAAAATENLKTKIIGLDDIDPQFGNKIVSALDDLKFQLAGGLPLQKMTDDIIAAFDAGKITPEQAQGMLGEAFVGSESLKVKMGEITADDAAKSVSETLNVSLDDAKKLIADMDSGLRNLPTSIDVRLNFIETGDRSPGRTSNAPANFVEDWSLDNGTGNVARASGGPVYPGMTISDWRTTSGQNEVMIQQPGYVLTEQEAKDALAGARGGATIKVTQIINTPLDYVEAAAEIEEIVRRNR